MTTKDSILYTKKRMTMMDAHDTNLPLEQGKLEEDKEVLEATDNTITEASDTEKQEEEVPSLTSVFTKEEVITRLKELEANVEETPRQELEGLKQAFYKLYNSEQEAIKKEFIENGGVEEEFKPEADPLEVEFKALMSSIREKRSEKAAEQEKIKEENLQKKLDIIERLKEILAQSEDVNKYFNEVRQLQQQWNEIKLVPQGKVNELWKNFQHYVEQFYDVIKINKEFRDYDFKKNLELKTNLCIAAEKLADEADVISAFYQLQKLHQEYRDTGPVIKEQREEIWARFKAASTAVNRRHQQHFETLKESEQRNLDEKTVICEIVEAIEYGELTGFTAWENKTKEVIALQNKWKTIGFAPQKMNVKIFERFRGACDIFFQKKAEFYKVAKENMNQNLDKKRALCEKAESLKDSTDWKETAEILTKLQKEWKSIGSVPKKYSDSIWKRFISACDFFFEQKNKATSSQRSVEIENLEKKKEIIVRLAAIDEKMEADEAVAKVRELMKEWSAIGYVPFREKDKIYKEYHDLIDKHFEHYNMNTSLKKLNNFRSSIGGYNKGEKGGAQSIYRERERLVRIYENMKSEIQTYENNLGFLTSSSKKGNSLVTELTRKVEKLKADLELTLQKIKVIDESLKEE